MTLLSLSVRRAAGAALAVSLTASVRAQVESTSTQGNTMVYAGGGKYQFTLDTSEAPELAEWVRENIGPMAVRWYPRLIAMLPGEGYEAPTNVVITFDKEMNGVAYTSGAKIHCGARWMKNNLKGEARGAVFHEIVHVVQNYGWGRQHNPNAKRAPGWLVEGIPDYIRWFIYEPESHGADIVWMSKLRKPNPRFDGSYRYTANFLDWVTSNYDTNLVPRLNAVLRAGDYTDEIWKQRTPHTLEELGAAWKEQLLAQLPNKSAVPTAEAPSTNSLTAAEKATGWKLLFNGKDLSGWHNFKQDGVRAGWEVKDGALVCADPHNAGDLVTSNAFDWFELQLDYNISEGGNSGIMFHVTNEGRAAWATGPEFQLEDNTKASDPQRCGWLYALYQPPEDPKTGKPLDATKPAGEWNHVRLLISREKCVHEINGVKYFEYVLGSEEFNARVAKSKFSKMPNFAKSNSGFIALQGDHGQVSFRNIKIRPL